MAEGRLNTKGQAVVSRSKTGRGKVTAPIFLLVPQVKLPKRLDLARDADRALDSVPGLIVANWVEEGELDFENDSKAIGVSASDIRSRGSQWC